MLEFIIRFFGFLLALKISVITWECIYAVWVMKKKDLTERYGKGSWAFITGGSDGIGWEFTQRFAEMGFNVIIAARNMTRLQKREEELKKLFPTVKIQIMSIDLSKASTENFYTDVMNQIGDKDVSVLVNNAGVMIGELEQNSQQENLDAMTLNISPVVMFTKLFCERMELRENRSAILNASSMMTCFPAQNNSLYGSTKTVVKMFTLSEARNYEGKIDFTSFQPGPVQTQMMGFNRNILFGSTTQITVENILRSLGNTEVLTGHAAQEWGVWLGRFFLTFLPEAVCISLNNIVLFAVLGFERNSKTLMETPNRKRTFREKIERKVSSWMNTKN